MEKILKDAILKEFPKKRVTSLLYFGTRAFGINNSEDSDYDFLLVLDKYQNEDCIKIKKITDKKVFKNIDLGIGYLYYEDIIKRGKEHFQQRSLSTTFYSYLEFAKVLIGTNFFKDDPLHLSVKQLADLFDFKIQEYNGRCDKLYLQNLTIENIYKKESKYIRDMIKYLLVMKGFLNIKNISELSQKEICKRSENFFNKEITKRFTLLKNSSNSKSTLLELNKLRRDIYKVYLTNRY